MEEILSNSTAKGSHAYRAMQTSASTSTFGQSSSLSVFPVLSYPSTSFHISSPSSIPSLSSPFNIPLGLSQSKRRLPSMDVSTSSDSSNKRRKPPSLPPLPEDAQINRITN